MPPTRNKRTTRTSSAPYDMGNLNNWYSEQFRAKLAEWNIVVPANFSKADLKSLYLANLSSRSNPTNTAQGDGSMTKSQNVTVASNELGNSSNVVISSPSKEQRQSNSIMTPVSQPQDSFQTSAMVNIMNTMTNLMQKVMDKDSKEELSRKTLDNFSTDRSTGNDTRISVDSPTCTYGLHPEQINDNDYVSDSLREKIVNGKYVNMVLLLIPEFEQPKGKDRYRDARLNRSLNIEEFIAAFEKYKRIHCAIHPWRKPELDQYESNIIEISRVYGQKFYEYHKIFSQKCAVALEQGKKVNWAEKDKDLLQMIIGGTPCKTCSICKEVSHSTPFCPNNRSQFATHKYQNQTAPDNSNDVQRKPVICSFFNSMGCKKDKCTYLHACSQCNSVSHGKKHCPQTQIGLVMGQSQSKHQRKLHVPNKTN